MRRKLRHSEVLSIGLHDVSASTSCKVSGVIEIGCYDLRMELAIRIQIEELPEGLFLATSDKLSGLIAQGRTVAETLEIARDVAKKLLRARSERGGIPNFQTTSQQKDYTIVVAA